MSMIKTKKLYRTWLEFNRAIKMVAKILIFSKLRKGWDFQYYTTTWLSLKASFKEVFKSVLALRLPIISAQGT